MQQTPHLHLRVFLHPDRGEGVLDGLETIRVLHAFEGDAPASRQDAVVGSALQLLLVAATSVERGGGREGYIWE